MSHPLELVIRGAEPFVFIGDSAHERFPAMSYANASKKGHRVYYLDLGGLAESRGPVKGGKVYTRAEDIPSDRTDLAVIWTKPHMAARAVDVAHGLGSKRVWFSFQTGHPDAVARARSLGMTVVEVGRCPVYYMDGQIGACLVHTQLVKLSGLYAKPPRTEHVEGARELL